MSIPGDGTVDIARQVGHALEDEAAQPLAEVQRMAPEGIEYFSELEASISEWSFGYGVAWALARISDPLLGSRQTAQIAERAVHDAWRMFSAQSWTALMAEDRERRGPVDGGAPAPEGIRSAPEAQEAASQYGDFMGKVARARPRRPPPREE